MNYLPEFCASEVQIKLKEKRTVTIGYMIAKFVILWVPCKVFLYSKFPMNISVT